MSRETRVNFAGGQGVRAALLLCQCRADALAHPTALSKSVGWAKAMARLLTEGKRVVRRAHHEPARLVSIPFGGHGVRTALLCVNAVPAPLPTLRHSGP